MSNPSPIVHVEISAEDRQESADFYAKIFGWEMQHHDEMNYTTFSTGQENMGGGLNPVSDDIPAGTVVVYIGSEDIEADLEKIEAHGGQTLVPKTEIPQMGWFAWFKDPSGNTLALYTNMPGAG